MKIYIYNYINKDLIKEIPDNENHVPRQDEYLIIENVEYLVLSVNYNYDSSTIIIWVKKCRTR